MGMMINRGNMTFWTEIRDYDLEMANGWTPDCGGKWDYDPTLVSISSRLYPNHMWACSVYFGEREIFDSGFQQSESHEAAKAAVEAFCQRHANRVERAVYAAYGVELPTKVTE